MKNMIMAAAFVWMSALTSIGQTLDSINFMIPQALTSYSIGSGLLCGELSVDTYDKLDSLGWHKKPEFREEGISYSLSQWVRRDPCKGFTLDKVMKPMKDEGKTYIEVRVTFTDGKSGGLVFQWSAYTKPLSFVGLYSN
jgi:hypothetical protein